MVVDTKGNESVPFCAKICTELGQAKQQDFCSWNASLDVTLSLFFVFLHAGWIDPFVRAKAPLGLISASQ